MSGLELTWSEANDWNDFWDKEMELGPNKLNAFTQNYMVMREMLTEHFGGLVGKTSMEVGCGRGVISKYLRLDGVDTSGMDMFSRFRNFNHNFIQGDILQMSPGAVNAIIPRDIVFTYGLLEHYSPKAIGRIQARCNIMCRPGGMIIHYCVPDKLTNRTANRDVYRDDLKWMKINHEQLWVYPCFPWMDWRTNKWFGRGFFIWESK
jgi:2-polyprenyl-3-methyl-5-hydroxy-6-metoxy-1,4-benzoquinol methylase